MELKKTVLILSTYGYLDPPLINTAFSLSEKFEKVYLLDLEDSKPVSVIKSNIICLNKPKKIEFNFLKINKIVNLLIYFIRVRKYIYKYRPDLIVTFMFHPILAINSRNQKVVSCIYDIPNLQYNGFLDKIINRIAFSRLKNSYLIWCSDKFKSIATKRLSKLKSMPFVCHNTPNINYMNGITKKKSRVWLTDFLNKKNIKITSNTIIIVRAGAVGYSGGIEQTLESLKRFNKKFFFIMMGRPSNKFKEEISKSEFKNCYLFENPDNFIWKKVLSASDIGHMIHLSSKNKHLNEMYNLNSSLSNNRLFQYMAAGLPIISYNDERLNDIHQEVNSFIVVEKCDLQNDIEKKLNKIIEKKINLEQLSKNSLKSFKNKYNWNNQFQKVLEKI